MRSLAIISELGDRLIFTHLTEDKMDFLTELCDIACWTYEFDPEDA